MHIVGSWCFLQLLIDVIDSVKTFAALVGFAVVKKGRDKMTGDIVAIKVGLSTSCVLNPFQSGIAQASVFGVGGR
jgi:hypothetical protein